MLTERMISRKKAVLIIISLIIALAASCAVVGYKIYMVENARQPQLKKDETALVNSVAKNPGDLRLHLDLARVYYLQNKNESALKEYRKSLVLDKNCTEAIYYIGLIALDKKDYHEAERQIRRALMLSPRNKGAELALAHIYRDSKQWDKAAKQYERVMAISPSAADIKVELGLVFEVQGKKNEALRQYREALQYVPEYKPAIEGINRLDQR